MVHAAASHSEFGWIVHPDHCKLHCAARQTSFFPLPRVTGARSAAGCPAELRSLTCARIRNFAVFINFFVFFVFSQNFFFSLFIFLVWVSPDTRTPTCTVPGASVSGYGGEGRKPSLHWRSQGRIHGQGVMRKSPQA